LSLQPEWSVCAAYWLRIGILYARHKLCQDALDRLIPPHGVEAARYYLKPEAVPSFGLGRPINDTVLDCGSDQRASASFLDRAR
jgi:hypothetical protein